MGRAFNKRDMAEFLVDSGKFKNKVTAHAAINAVLESIEEGLNKKNKVVLVGFGTFEVRATKKRKGRNIHTGEEVLLPKHNHVHFRVGKTLKQKFE